MQETDGRALQDARHRAFRQVWSRRRFFNLALGIMTIVGPAGRLQAQAPKRLMLLGDSLTAGFGLPKCQAFPARLEAALAAAGVAAEVIDAGVSGHTTAGGLARLDWSLAANPHAVVIALGANDGLRGLDPRQTEANLDAIVTRLKARNIAILLAGMYAPPNLGRDYGDAFNAVFPRLAARHGVALYPFFLDGVAADPALNQADGIHPNARGVEIIVARILPAVRSLLAA